MRAKSLGAAVALLLSATLLSFPASADPEIKGRRNSLVLGASKQDPASVRAPKGTRGVRTIDRGRDTACAMPDRYERTYRCGARGTTATDTQPATAPQVTEGDIRRAVSEIPMPSLQIQVQPGERTLVNVPTIFHTDPRTLRESVTLLGFDIDVEATPTRYTWHPGDGTSKSTTKPGRPYPAKDVTHTYRRVADEVRPRVDTTYSVRYRVDGGAWTPLGQTLTAQGAPTSLEVEEAAPVLVTP